MERQVDQVIEVLHAIARGVGLVAAIIAPWWIAIRWFS